MKRNLSVKRAQDDVAAYLAAKGSAWSGPERHYYVVTHLVEEVGELARAVINLEEKVTEPRRRGLGARKADKMVALKDTIGDSFFCLLGICIAYGVDMQEAFELSFAAIKKKYPVRRESRDNRR